MNYFLPLLIMDDKNNKPVHSERLRGLAASVFANSAKDSSNPFYKVSLQRTYKDGDEFKTTTSLGRDDLPIAELLLKRAWIWIMNAESADRKSADGGK